MAWKELQGWFRSVFGGKAGTASHRPDGGTSCYRPVQRRNRQEENAAREKAAEYAAGQPSVAYAHTGFTGMNPPATGMAPVQSTLTADPYGYGAAQAAQQMYKADYYAAQNNPQRMDQGAGQQAFWGGSAPQPPAGQMNNISYMPGVYMPDAGNSFTHVEHIMAITSLQSCYEAIECMKNGETLIVTMDVLGSEGERIRCQDMLAGAAFTLQCEVRPVSGNGVTVIAPSGVKILPEQQNRRFEEPDPYRAPVQPYPAEDYTPRRERRVSHNSVGWETANQSGAQGFNPYTGSMPAAAGDYGAYGGY